MGFDLQLSEDGRFVHFHPTRRGESLEEFVHRIGAIGTFAERHGTRRILMDYRDGFAPIAEEFLESILASPWFKQPRRWRLAVLGSFGTAAYNLEVISGFVDMLDALDQEAKQFQDFDEAVRWLCRPTDDGWLN